MIDKKPTKQPPIFVIEISGEANLTDADKQNITSVIKQMLVEIKKQSLKK